MNSNIMIDTDKHLKSVDIRCNFTKFKYGLIQRLVDNYEDTIERQQAINSIVNARLYQSINFNYFCNDVLPILWKADPPQNEKKYCYNAPSVIVRIMCNCNNKELKVRSYFYGNLKGSPIKGSMNIDEYNNIETLGLNTVIKRTAIREVAEEVGFNLEFIDDEMCKICLYDTSVNGSYKIDKYTVNKFDGTKHMVLITLDCNSYDTLKNTISMNYYDQKKFLENTGEISGIVL
jgi:hypothetical protein